jgi:hypothetical protein
MAIPEEQLERWSHQGAVKTAKDTHESIRSALKLYQFPQGTEYEVYLQGSYKNDTNIRGDSDVDVVVQLNSTFKRDLSGLSDYERLLYERLRQDATYLWEHLRADVVTALRKHFGVKAVTEGNKAIELASAPGRLASHIIACLLYKKYLRFQSFQDENYIEGIAFFAQKENRLIINYPKFHYNNGVLKNSAARTNGNYKPTVRIFKNARTHLVNKGNIGNELAPSYFVECLIYNVADTEFCGSYSEIFCNVVNFLTRTKMDSFVCQNGQMLLFDNTPEQWSIQNAKEYVDALVNLWNNW